MKSFAFATFGFIVHSISLGGTFLRLGFFSLYIRFRSGALVSGLDFLACLRGHYFFFPGRLSAARDRTWFGFADILLKFGFFHAAKCPFSSLLSGSVWPCTYLTKSDRAGLCAKGTLERASFLLLFVAVLLLRCALHVG